jgi:hypothetical protein
MKTIRLSLENVLVASGHFLPRVAITPSEDNTFFQFSPTANFLKKHLFSKRTLRVVLGHWGWWNFEKEYTRRTCSKVKMTCSVLVWYWLLNILALVWVLGVWRNFIPAWSWVLFHPSYQPGPLSGLKAHFRWGPGSKFLGTNLDPFEASWILELYHALDPSLHLGSPNHELSFELIFKSSKPVDFPLKIVPLFGLGPSSKVALRGSLVD